MQRSAARVISRQATRVLRGVRVSKRLQSVSVVAEPSAERAEDSPFLSQLRPRGPASAVPSTSAATLDADEKESTLTAEQARQAVETALQDLRRLHARFPDVQPVDVVSQYAESKRKQGKKQVFPPALLDVGEYARSGIDWTRVLQLQVAILAGSVFGLWMRKALGGPLLRDRDTHAMSMDDSSELEVQSLNLLMASYAFDGEHWVDKKSAMAEIESFAGLVSRAEQAADPNTIRLILAYVARLARLDSKGAFFRRTRRTFTALAWRLGKDYRMLDSEFIETTASLRASYHSTDTVSVMLKEMLSAIHHRADVDIATMIQAAISTRHAHLTLALLSKSDLPADRLLGLTSAALTSFAEDFDLRRDERLVSGLAARFCEAVRQVSAQSSPTPDERRGTVIQDGLEAIIKGFAISRQLDDKIYGVAEAVVLAGDDVVDLAARRYVAALALRHLADVQNWTKLHSLFELAIERTGEHRILYYPLIGARHKLTSDYAFDRLMNGPLELDERALWKRLSSHVKTERYSFGIREALRILRQHNQVKYTKRIADKLLQLGMRSRSYFKVRFLWRLQLRNRIPSDAATYAILLERFFRTNRYPSRRRFLRHISTTLGHDLSSSTTTTTTSKQHAAADSTDHKWSRSEVYDTLRLARSFVPSTSRQDHVSGEAVLPPADQQVQMTFEEAIEASRTRCPSRVSNVVALRVALVRWRPDTQIVVELARSLLRVHLTVQQSTKASPHSVDSRSCDKSSLDLPWIEGKDDLTLADFDEWRAATYGALWRALDDIGDYETRRALTKARIEEKHAVWINERRRAEEASDKEDW